PGRRPCCLVTRASWATTGEFSQPGASKGTRSEVAMTEPTRDALPGPRTQMEVYQAGLLGKTPAQPVAIEELERKAREVLPPEAYDYLAGGAGAEDTMRANRDAFRRWR